MKELHEPLSSQGVVTYRLRITVLVAIKPTVSIVKRNCMSFHPSASVLPLGAMGEISRFKEMGGRCFDNRQTSDLSSFLSSLDLERVTQSLLNK